MARKSEQRTKLIVGIFVLVLTALSGLSLFIIGQSEGSWKPKTTVFTDFKTITGLRKGSSVQLAGVEVGTVHQITFAEVTYTCNPDFEDYGRYGAERSDDCDPFLFCSPAGVCGELEPWASKGQHDPCLSSEDCASDEVCVTKDFRRRFRRVFWAGQDGVCARYNSDLRRVRVAMNIFEDKLSLIRSDSRATVASNGVLGDQLVNINPGIQAPVPPGGRIQSTPSLWEDIELFRTRIEGITDKVDSSLAGISSLFSELNDDRTIRSIKGTFANIQEISRQLAEGEGLAGALLNDDRYREDFAVTLRGVRNTAVGLDQFVGRANKTLAKADANLQPMIDDARATMGDLRKMLGDLKDPKNKSVAAKLLYDDEGKLVKDVEKIIDDMQKFTDSATKVAKRIEAGKGTLGKFVNDPKAHDDLVKILRGIDRNNTLKSLVRMSIEADEANKPAADRRAAKRAGGK